MNNIRLKLATLLTLFAFCTLFIACNGGQATTDEVVESTASRLESDAKTENKENNKSESNEIQLSNASEINFVEASAELLRAVKHGKNTKPYQDKIANADKTELAQVLADDDHKFTFWINLYNAYIQITLSENAELYKNDKNAFFKKEQIQVAGETISFDKIEHGMIRSSTMKLSLGYLPKLFSGDFEQLLRVSEEDPRYHFVLNCGAKSCPPVHVFEEASIDREMGMVARDYLNEVTEYKPDSNIVKTTKLFSWYRGDFGGKDGGIEFLKKHEIIPQSATDVEMKFKPYDWTLALDNFANPNNTNIQ